MYALISLLIIISLSLLIVRIGTVALTMTGLSKDVASFQALSAFSGAGFTTDEAEEVISYPSRRRIVKTLIRLGSVGLVTTIASLVLSFTDPATRLSRLGILIGFLTALLVLSQSRWFHELLTPLIRWGLRQTAQFELRDYTGLLNLHRDYRVADLTVSEGDWLADERIGDLELRSEEGVMILGIRREDGTYIGAPGGDHEIKPGDTLVAYGQENRLQEIITRTEGDEAARERAREQHRRLLDLERRLDPERSD